MLSDCEVLVKKIFCIMNFSLLEEEDEEDVISSLMDEKFLPSKMAEGGLSSLASLHRKLNGAKKLNSNFYYPSERF